MNKIIICIVFAALIIGGGCKNKEAKDAYLIRVGQCQVTVFEFNTALEMAKIAYPHNVVLRPEALKAIQMRLLNQMIEELILLCEAKRLTINVTDTELDNAMGKIIADYPSKEEFRNSLLENAISFESWKKRLRTRMIMEKVVEVELEDKIMISQEDISQYYTRHYSDKAKDEEDPKKRGDINRQIVRQLRKHKAEGSYDEWIKKLKEKYQDKIEINKTLWNKIVY